MAAGVGGAGKVDGGAYVSRATPERVRSDRAWSRGRQVVSSGPAETVYGLTAGAPLHEAELSAVRPPGPAGRLENGPHNRLYSPSGGPGSPPGLGSADGSAAPSGRERRPCPRVRPGSPWGPRGSRTNRSGRLEEGAQGGARVFAIGARRCPEFAAGPILPPSMPLVGRTPSIGVPFHLRY